MGYVGSGSGFGRFLFVNRDEQKVWTTIPAYPVASLEDLPAPVAGVITLPNATVWQFLGNVDITPNILSLGTGTSILGTVPGRSVIITDNPLAAVGATAGVGGRAVEDVTITNTSGPAMDFRGGSATNLLIDTVVAENCGGAALLVGDIPGLFLRSLLIENCEDGVVASGTNGFLRIEDVACATHPPGFTGVNLLPGLIASEVRIQNCTFLLNNITDIGLQLDAAGVDRALVDGNQFPGGVGTTRAGAITPATARWLFDGNQGIRNSTVIGDARYNGAPIVVPIVAATEWVDLTALGLTLVASERMSLVGDALRYDGIDPGNLRITAQISAEHAAGGNRAFEITVQIGGSPVIGSTINSVYAQSGEMDNADMTQFSTTLTIVDAQPGDLFRILVRNMSDATNLEAVAAALTISEG